MRDREHGDDVLLVIDCVQRPVLAPPGHPHAIERRSSCLPRRRGLTVTGPVRCSYSAVAPATAAWPELAGRPGRIRLRTAPDRSLASGPPRGQVSRDLLGGEHPTGARISQRVAQIAHQPRVRQPSTVSRSPGQLPRRHDISNMLAVGNNRNSLAALRPAHDLRPRGLILSLHHQHRPAHMIKHTASTEGSPKLEKRAGAGAGPADAGVAPAEAGRGPVDSRGAIERAGRRGQACCHAHDVRAREQVAQTFAMLTSGRPRERAAGLMLAGVAMHTFLDTYAHEGFTAYPSTQINTRTDLWPLARVGHIDAPEQGHAPDRPYNEVNKALEALHALYDLIAQSGQGKRISWYKLEPELRIALSARQPVLADRMATMGRLIRTRFGDNYKSRHATIRK